MSDETKVGAGDYKARRRWRERVSRFRRFRRVRPEPHGPGRYRYRRPYPLWSKSDCRGWRRFAVRVSARNRWRKAMRQAPYHERGVAY